MSMNLLYEIIYCKLIFCPHRGSNVSAACKWASKGGKFSENIWFLDKSPKFWKNSLWKYNFDEKVPFI